MLISGINERYLVNEKNKAVEITTSISSQTSYFQDRNPEHTRNSDFTRALEKATRALIEEEGRRKRFRETKDFKELQTESAGKTPEWVETMTHVSQWETGRATRMDLLVKTGW